VGLAAIAPLLMGLLLGVLIDDRLDTSPWGTLALAVAGSSAGMAGVWRLSSTYVRRMTQRSQEDNR